MGQRYFTLWDLLTILPAPAAAAGGAIAAAHTGAGAANARVLLAVAIALCVGMACIWVARKAEYQLYRFLVEHTGSNGKPLLTETTATAAFLLGLAWVIVSTVLGFHATKIVIAFLR